ncbi:hypothetical protein GCM10010423_65560 [Streptomyces levis]|uniref:Uncharacterized protein n=1 Tax=Streptomyces levis TaxID=285566 RepID=A0ABN3P0Y2_9ACTN
MERTKIWVVSSHAGVEGVYWDEMSADVKVSSLKELNAYKRDDKLKAEEYPVLGGGVEFAPGKSI